MTVEELQEALHTKGYRYQERLDENAPNVLVVWAVEPHNSPRQYHLGVKETLLALPLSRFLQLHAYEVIGKTREDLIDEFVSDLFRVFAIQADSQDRKNWSRRTMRLYDELRLADW